MRFGVLGPVTVWTAAGEPAPIPGLKVRALLADLLIHNGRPVSTDRLVDDLWGDDHPANPTGALQVRVSQLRKALDDAEPGARALIESRPPGYLINSEAVDARQFATLAERAQETEDPRQRAALLGDALALWRGAALADFADEEFARSAIARLDEQRLAVLELHAEARLALGEHGLLAGELGELVARHPLRERLRAAQLRALYAAGRQSEALDSYADLRKHLADELGLEPGPELVALHQAILEQDPALDPAAPPSRPRTNLPAPISELIGRAATVTELTALVHKGRLVTLTGSGGVGKTRLAIETARAVLDAYPDGVWFIDLAAADANTTLPDLILDVLEIRDTAGTGERLAAALRARKLLLLLDNCEHLLDKMAELAELLLHSAPGLRILATSREPLGLAGESLWEVEPLTVPDAIELFVARVPGFSVDTGNREAVAELCGRLDGIPLALELAATRVRALGVHGLLARLDDRFRLLSTGHRGAPARQQTLAAVIDWSWNLLTEPERVVLRRLAVHLGGSWALDAAEAVCGAADTLELLARLVDRSLVVMHDRADGPRYRLLESVAAYCVQRLTEAGELDTITKRHNDYYADLAARAEPFLRGPEQRHWLHRLDAESANLRAAIETAVCAGDAERALGMANSLSWYWFLRGRLTAAHRALTEAIGIAADSPARARATAWHTGISLLLGDKTDWAARRDAAVAGFKADSAARAHAEWFLAFVGNDLGDLPATEALLDRALATFEKLDDRWGTAATLVVRAKLAHVRSDPATVAALAERGVAIFRSIGDRWGIGQATEWLAAHADMVADYDLAARLHREGLRQAEELELWPEVAGRLCWLGWIAIQVGDFRQARELCERAMRLAVEQDSQPSKEFAELIIGVAARREGNLDLAEKHLRNLREAARSEDNGHALYLNLVLMELGFAAEIRGNAAEALALHREALDIAVHFDESRAIAGALIGIAGATAQAGDHPLAARLLGAAAAIRQAPDMPPAPDERDEINRITETVRAALGADAFAAEHALGGESDLLTLLPAGNSE